MCLLLTVFAIGPLTTTLSLHDYFTSPSLYEYIRANVIIPGRAHLLPGVFEMNTYRGVVNGSLWTLVPEIACYTFVFVAGILGCLVSPRITCLAVIALVVLHFVSPATIPYFSDAHYSDALKVACCFLAGVLAYAARERLILSWRFTMILILAAVLARRTEWAEYLLYAALLYTVLLVAASPTLQRIKLPGDYSFGVYIYGFLIQQTLNHIYPTLESYPSNIICLPTALLCGFLSWTFVELPAMQRIRRLASWIDTQVQNRVLLKWLELHNGRLAIVDIFLRRLRPGNPPRRRIEAG